MSVGASSHKSVLVSRTRDCVHSPPRRFGEANDCVICEDEACEAGGVHLAWNCLLGFACEVHLFGIIL